MKLYSWNVNGLRACLQKGFLDVVKQSGADCFCVQETKMQQGQAEISLPGYFQYFNSAEKKGYSGTAVFTKREPVCVTCGIGVDEHDHEGRVLTLEFVDWYLVNVYAPNSQDKLARLSYSMQWEDAFRGYLLGLNEKKPVIVCGDMNVAHQEIDLKNPKTNRQNAGFSDEERAKMTELLSSGFCDSFRLIYPDATGVYSWWSYRFSARKNNAGWRIDYFLVSDKLKKAIKEAEIHMDIMGSDHCPVSLTIDLPE